MAEELKWSDAEQKKQHAEAVKFLREEMGQQVNRQSRDKIAINLSREEISNYIKRFQALDKEKKGYISINDIRRGLKVRCLHLISFKLVFLVNRILGLVFKISESVNNVAQSLIYHRFLSG